MVTEHNAGVTAGDVAPQALVKIARRLGERPAYFVRGEGGWEPTLWRDMLAEVQAAGRALIAAGLQPGQPVCILGFNRPEWLVMAHAAMMAGGSAAGIYWTSAPPEVEYILNHSAAPVLLLEDGAQMAKIAMRRDALPGLKTVVAMRGAPVEGALSWAEFLALGEGPRRSELQAELERRMAAIHPTDLGGLIYTSGTTGHPKAVMLSHANLAWAAQTLNDAFELGVDDRLISYLPMAHVAEMVGTIHSPARMGNAIYFARSIDMLLDHMKEVRPTVYFGVPRLWEKMQAGLYAKIASATGFKAHLARWAMGVSQRWHTLDLEGRAKPFALDLQMTLARRLVLSKVRAALGLDQARLLISGAAPISLDNLRFFLGLDLVVRELYGQSEVCGPTTISHVGSTRLGAVGKPLKGLDLRIAPDGEVLVRSPGVFVGYAGQPEATSETLVDGWLHSGDLGRIDEQGYLHITGRKKDLIITSGGKNISPANIESALMGRPLIEHAVVVGDGRHFLSALLTLDAEAAAEFARCHGLPVEGIAGHPLLREVLQKEVDDVNSELARVATIRKFVIIDGGLSIEKGQLTATLKIRRNAVIAQHRDVVEALYHD